MSLLGYQEFLEWRRYIVVETYDRDGGHEHPRFRIELRAPVEVVQAALVFKMRCVACARHMFPFRLRSGSRVTAYGAGVYFAATCPLNVSMGCSRSRAAAEEYKLVANAVLAPAKKGEPPNTQGALPGLR